MRTISGQEEPNVQGWIALGHGKRGFRPIQTLSLSQRKTGPAEFAYVFFPAPDAVSGIGLTRTGNNHAYQVVLPNARCDIVLDDSGGVQLTSYESEQNVV